MIFITILALNSNELLFTQIPTHQQRRKCGITIT